MANLNQMVFIELAWAIYLESYLCSLFGPHILWVKNTARNKQIVLLEESEKTVKLKLFLEKAQKFHQGNF